MELADEELADRPDATLSSFSHSTVSSSGPACSQQAIPSSCGSWKRRLFLAAPLCLFALLGVLAALCRGTAPFGPSAPGPLQSGRGAFFGLGNTRLAGCWGRGRSPLKGLGGKFPKRQVVELKRMRRMLLGSPASVISDELDGNFVQMVQDSKRSWDIPGNISSKMSLAGSCNEGIYLGEITGLGEVVMKVHRFPFSLPMMYEVDSRSRLINSIRGENLLGYKQVIFHGRNKSLFYVTFVMERGGQSAICIVSRNLCPEEKTREGQGIWAKNAFSVKQKAAVVLGALRAVLAMQEKGFLNHGDVKSVNLLIPVNAPRLTPTELANRTRLIDHDFATFDVPDLPHFRPDRTLFFAPLEFVDWHRTRDKAAGREIYLRMDVFSCGMTLFELVVGKSPQKLFVEIEGNRLVQEQHVMGQFEKLFRGPLNEELERISGFAADSDVLRLLQGMLAPNWQARWDTAKAVEQVQSFCCGEQ